MITIPWLILERTDSPAFAGLVAAISALPGILVSPIGGWMVDHIGRRAVSIGADILSAFSVATFPIVAATFGLSNLSILLIAVLGAVFDPAGYTARKTLLADVAKASDSDLNHLNGIHDGIMAIAWVFGPAVGAALIASVGAINSFWVSAALFILAALVIAFLRVGDEGKESRELAKEAGEVTDARMRVLHVIHRVLVVFGACQIDIEHVLGVGFAAEQKETHRVFAGPLNQIAQSDVTACALGNFDFLAAAHDTHHGV